MVSAHGYMSAIPLSQYQCLGLWREIRNGGNEQLHIHRRLWPAVRQVEMFQFVPVVRRDIASVFVCMVPSLVLDGVIHNTASHRGSIFRDRIVPQTRIPGAIKLASNSIEDVGSSFVMAPAYI